MKNFSLARRYARALYELAEENKVLDDVMLSLGNITRELERNPDLGKALANPLLSLLEKESLIKTITSNKLVLKLISLLGKRDRMDLIVLIADELIARADQDRGLHRVMIKTAHILSDAQKKLIEQTLAKTLGGSVLGKFDVAKELIGGIWVRMGDKVLDATLKGRIDNLRFVLTHSTN